jgi:hypothetical protein
LCWNPVITSTLAVCTETGGLNLYLIKDTGIQFHSIDPSLKAKCCCWSPKGKQIVAGFASGKLMQFTLELKPARTIECPPNVFPGNFDTAAVQWLSTYQFAIVLLGIQEESRPGKLFIVIVNLSIDRSTFLFIYLAIKHIKIYKMLLLKLLVIESRFLINLSVDFKAHVRFLPVAHQIHLDFRFHCGIALKNWYFN